MKNDANPGLKLCDYRSDAEGLGIGPGFILFQFLFLYLDKFQTCWKGFNAEIQIATRCIVNMFETCQLEMFENACFDVLILTQRLPMNNNATYVNGFGMDEAPSHPASHQ